MNEHSFLEILPPVAFAAGEQRSFYITGSYFEIIDAVDPVDIVLSDAYGARRGLMKGAEASFHLKNTPFGFVQISSATAQTIRFAYGSGEAGTRRAAGAVTIVGTVPVSMLAADKLELLRPVLPTNAWNSSATMAAGVPLTVFAPGANVNGAIIWTAESSDVSGSNNLQSFIAKNAAPANVYDGEIVALGKAGPFAANVGVTIELAQPQRIAAGLGLYFISGFVGLAGFGRHARYTLL